MVRSLIQTTDAVPARDAWSYWKDTVLPTIEGIRVVEDQPFGAQRSITALTGGIILDTASSPVLVHRSAQRLAHDYAGYVALTLFVEGHGLTDPRDIGGKSLAKGDIALCDLSRPYKAAGLTDYRELRLYMPRASFDERIGDIGDLIDLKISATARFLLCFLTILKEFATNCRMCHKKKPMPESMVLFTFFHCWFLLRANGCTTRVSKPLARLC